MKKAKGDELSKILHKTKLKLFEREHQIAFRVQLISAIFVLHSHDIVHRDIKPENAWYDFASKELRLMDFSESATIPKGKHSKECVGTPAYVAPEILDGGIHDRSADIWSLAIMMGQFVQFSTLCDEARGSGEDGCRPDGPTR